MRKKSKKKIVVKKQVCRGLTWALDLGQYTGWATRDDAGVIDARAPVDLWHWLNENIGVHLAPECAVVYENAAYIQVSESAKAAFYARKTAVELWCELNDVLCESVVVATWQAWAKKQIENFPPLPKKCEELIFKEKLYPKKNHSKARKADAVFDRLHLAHQRALRERKVEAKQAYLDKAREKFQIAIPDHNAGDARWVLGYYDEFVGVL